VTGVYSVLNIIKIVFFVMQQIVTLLCLVTIHFIS